MTTIRNLLGYTLSRSTGRTQARNVLGYAIIDTGDKLTRPTGDTDYRKPEQTLLYELIDRANPEAFVKIDRNQVVFEAPVAIPNVRGDQSNTSIIAKAAPNALDVIGRQTLKYRRIELASLFREQTVVLTRYKTTNSLPYAEVQELLLSQHGINIAAGTFTPVALPPDVPRAFPALATSLCYTGSVTVVWRKGKREISDMITDGKLDGRVWPEGLIQFGDTYRPQGEYIAYDTDFTDTMAAQFNSWGHGAQTGSVPLLDLFANVLNSMFPQYNWNSGMATLENKGGLQNLLFQRFALPNAAVPEANSALFNRVAVLTPNVGESWFQGRLLFHYRA